MMVLYSTSSRSGPEILSSARPFCSRIPLSCTDFEAGLAGDTALQADAIVQAVSSARVVGLGRLLGGLLIARLLCNSREHYYPRRAPVGGYCAGGEIYKTDRA